MVGVLGAVIPGLLLVACTREDAARERPSASAPRDWAARHNEITRAPRLERRDDDAGGPSLAPAPTTPETRALGQSVRADRDAITLAIKRPHGTA